MFLTTGTGGPKPTRRIHAEIKCQRTKCIDVFIHIIVITEEVITLLCKYDGPLQSPY
jgi:hypothetical protein